MGRHETFKVGQRVNWTRVPGKYDGSTIKAIDYGAWPVTIEANNGETTYAAFSELEPAPLFAVGDKVRFTDKVPTSFWFGPHTSHKGGVVSAVNENICGADYDVDVSGKDYPAFVDADHIRLAATYSSCAAAEVDNLADEYGGRKKFVAGDRVKRINHDNNTIMTVGTEWTVDHDMGGGWLSMEGGQTGLAANFEHVAVAPAPATPTATLRIQAGSYYKTRDGRKVGPMRAYTGSENNAHPWQANIDGGYHGCTTGFIFKVDGRNYEYTNLDLIAEWPVEVAPVVAPATTAKFKVGDRVKVGLTGNEYTITSTRMGRLGKIIYDAVGAGKSGGSFFAEHLDLLPPTTMADIVRKHSGTAVVMLIENGQPKPSEAPHVHSNQWLAGNEADRLAGIHKGQEFGVYTCVDVKKVEKPAYEHEWQRLAATGRVIEAIKTLRAMTGLGLKTSKDAVEDWRNRELLAA